MEVQQDFIQFITGRKNRDLSKIDKSLLTTQL